MFRLVINPNKEKGHINPEIQGHFSEHLGRCIYEGVYVFTTNNHEMGNLSDRDFDTYMELFNQLAKGPGILAT